ncbi:MAG: hypothetical protein HYZ58_10160 [Acidobacteria bacterium]|nr:hypothetical protein [Acidobacteriota bacterium]MBI3263498.1 hypothetical protein [Acidobacteriota bacterium]
MELDASKWSGEGEFTHRLVELLKELPEVVFVRVEDAPATRAESGYSFIANELYVGFGVRSRVESTRRFGVFPSRQVTEEPVMTLSGLGEVLAARNHIGPADYSDEGMIQYLRTERIVPPYQTRGYKLVELVRIYRAGDAPRR